MRPCSPIESLDCLRCSIKIAVLALQTHALAAASTPAIELYAASHVQTGRLLFQAQEQIGAFEVQVADVAGVQVQQAVRHILRNLHGPGRRTGLRAPPQGASKQEGFMSPCAACSTLLRRSYIGAQSHRLVFAPVYRLHAILEGSQEEGAPEPASWSLLMRKIWHLRLP